MKKIMFNDKYDLTTLVLAEVKTQTRRVIPSADHENRRYEGAPIFINHDGTKSVLAQFSDKIVLSAYAIGEVVAIAQAYKDIPEFPLLSKQGVEELKQSPGWRNKMFVGPVLMPHHIRITNIRVERLRDISDNDCLAEGIYKLKNIYTNGWNYSYRPIWRDLDMRDLFVTPKFAYVALIDKVSGKGTWDSNPFVFVYEFELVD